MQLGRRFGCVVFGDSAGFQEILVIIRLAPFPIFGAGAKFHDGRSAVLRNVAGGAEIPRMMGTATATTWAEDEAHSYFMNDSNELKNISTSIPSEHVATSTHTSDFSGKECNAE